MKDLAKSEWELMLWCWKLGQPTARQVHAAAAGERQRDYRTVLATLNNIAAKGFLRVEKCSGLRNIPTNRYVPAISKRSALERRISSFLAEDLRWDDEALDLLDEAVRRGRPKPRQAG